MILKEFNVYTIIRFLNDNHRTKKHFELLDKES
jgi:hypothetical protein